MEKYSYIDRKSEMRQNCEELCPSWALPENVA